MPETAQHVITTYVSDMLAVLKEASLPLDAQCQDNEIETIPELARLVPRIKATIDNQINLVENHLEELGGHEAGAIKNVVTSIIGSGAIAVNKLRNKGRLSKMLRDDYTSLSLMCVSYEMLHATSVGLADRETAQLALSCMRNITPLIMDISQTIPSVVIHEFKQENQPVDENAIRESCEEVRKAWCQNP